MPFGFTSESRSLARIPHERFERSQLFDGPGDNAQTATWYRSVAAVWEED